MCSHLGDINTRKYEAIESDNDIGWDTPGMCQWRKGLLWLTNCFLPVEGLRENERRAAAAVGGKVQTRETQNHPIDNEISLK